RHEAHETTEKDQGGRGSKSDTKGHTGHTRDERRGGGCEGGCECEWRVGRRPGGGRPLLVGGLRVIRRNGWTLRNSPLSGSRVTCERKGR
ncbi:MAG: hypothetical protein P4M11_14460, partial [Candidatus Pacebacteria bacterium]|nr:hypothetical protein [Candidatus Paceibacterota bacterium]